MGVEPGSLASLFLRFQFSFRGIVWAGFVAYRLADGVIFIVNFVLFGSSMSDDWILISIEDILVCCSLFPGFAGMSMGDSYGHPILGWLAASDSLAAGYWSFPILLMGESLAVVLILVVLWSGWFCWSNSKAFLCLLLAGWW